METQTISSEVAYERIAQILGCKWSISILDALARDVHRPGQIEREVAGISGTSMHRCINRLERDGIIEKTTYPEVPPRVEYRLTPFGDRFLELIRSARAIAKDWTGTGPYPSEE